MMIIIDNLQFCDCLTIFDEKSNFPPLGRSMFTMEQKVLVLLSLLVSIFYWKWHWKIKVRRILAPDEKLRWTDVKALFQNLNYTSRMADPAGVKSLLRYPQTGQELVRYILFSVYIKFNLMEQYNLSSVFNV